jgi:hypothetical protein
LFANLTESLKRRMILELRAFWAKDPKYRDTLVNNIQGRYSFKERPQQAIILKNASATPLQLSADHYQGTVISYCHLTRVYGQNGTSIEWVREDSRAIQANSGTFPSLPGIYYIEVRCEETTHRGVTAQHTVFYVDPLLEITDERAIMLGPRIYELGAGSFHAGSLRVYEMPGNLVFYEGINYEADPDTGTITLAAPLPPGSTMSCDYRYAGASTGPYLVPENGSNNRAIPGVVLAFGRRAHEGDTMAVVVTKYREDAAREYGGRWEMSLDFDIMARDVNAQGEITDRTLMYLYGPARAALSGEGIEITSASMGGEAEEIYDENGDDYFYTANLSLSVMTDWAIHVPLDYTFSRVLPQTLDSAQALAGLSDDQLRDAGSPTDLRGAQDIRLLALSDPWFRGRNKDYEMIR